MERNIFNDSFERMLKEKADEFKMYPSARVWHSIYNNMHPGRRWPSMTMSILLIAVLLMVGYINSEKATPSKTSEPKIVANNNIILPDHKMSSSGTENISIAANIKKNAGTIYTSQSLPVNFIRQAGINNALSIKKKPISSDITSDVINNGGIENKKISAIESTNKIFLIGDKKNNQSLKNNILVDKKSIDETDNSIEKLVAKKSVSKFGLQVYASPSVVYPNVSDNSTGISNDAIKPSVGLEVGAAMQYALFKKLKVTTGLQLNYMSYNSLGYLNEVASTNTLIKQSQNNQHIDNSGLTNTTGLYPVNFRNETYQVSLPVGVEFKLIGRDKLHWDIGATIQPTYIMTGNNNNGLKELSALNNWNLNAGFETFITYKINGLTWQLGPQFRYQLISTYDNSQLLNENLANYGVKLGVSKVLH